jgi:DNA repair protein RadC
VAVAIKDWPKQERPREKLLARGAEALSDAELLAIFLGSGVRGKSAVDVARALLGRFDGLRALLSAPRAEVCAEKGLGEVRYVLLQAALEDRAHEVFCCLFLDNRHRVLAFEELFRGTLNGTAVYPREIVKRAMHHNAAAVVLVHNHPSGVAEPSRADELLTARLKDALGTLDVRLLDHLVVGDGEMVSLAERGLV